MSELLLDISRMREARDRIERTFQPDAFDLSADVCRLTGPVHLALDITKDKDQFRLIGRIRAALELSCGRCLEPYSLPLDEPVDVLYLPHAKNTGEGELEIEDDDLATAYYQDQVIDLGHLMHEQFQLAVPMKPLCQPSCRGLCAICGINLNTATCECRPVWEDPRLAALRSLKTDGPPRR
jgi:uncharacterized protein